jgi:low affinity Fe/Cu permease
VGDFFHVFARRASGWMGSPWAFVVAVAIVVGWACVGPIFGFSDTWQLVINTGTTIVTFLMVFLIQNTQNRDAAVIHLKLDEILRALPEARNHLIDLEELSEEEIERIKAQFAEVHEPAGREARASVVESPPCPPTPTSRSRAPSPRSPSSR